MIWHPHCHGIHTSCGPTGNNITFRKYHCQWSRPIGISQKPGFLRYLCHDFFQGIHVCNVNDQRIIRGSSLGMINFLCCQFIQCISSKTINRFRWKRHKSALPDNSSGFLHSFPVKIPGLHPDYFCFHFNHLISLSFNTSFSILETAHGGKR